MMNTFNNLWCIDDITPIEEINRHLQQQSLIRLVSASKMAPFGLRYLLISNRFLQMHNSDEDNLISYGSALQLRPDPLKEATQMIALGTSAYRIPVLSQSNYGDCIFHDTVAEGSLIDELNQILRRAEQRDARPPSTDGDSISESGPTRIHVINVGQGDTILLELPGKKIWMIDGYFWRRDKYYEFRDWYNRRYSSWTLDKLIISHFHRDHIRYIPQIAKDLLPGEVVFPRPLSPPTGLTNAVLDDVSVSVCSRMVGKEETYSYRNVDLTIFPTEDFAISTNPNDHGLIVIANSGNSIALFPGDANAETICRFCNSLNSSASLHRQNCSLYKVTHHCSSSGATKGMPPCPVTSGFPRCLNLYRSVTSCAKKNRYGHPHHPPALCLNADYTFDVGFKHSYILR